MFCKCHDEREVSFCLMLQYLQPRYLSSASSVPVSLRFSSPVHQIPLHSTALKWEARFSTDFPVPSSTLRSSCILFFRQILLSVKTSFQLCLKCIRPVACYFLSCLHTSGPAGLAPSFQSYFQSCSGPSLLISDQNTVV